MVNIFSNAKINTSVWINLNKKGDIYNQYYNTELLAKLYK